ncbi:MAG: hypothetical protein RE471_03425 [Ferroplasma sp.]|uniref:hypothetical protein n=1 Tax=Ferroplasma sp. TaxID=2591003 RepID=UPI00281609FF|nr:hypothetical protein [Ferroplasma sp.]WMT51936.1 MAG: hypothetical protein RE471_03425 [Ferroplasma sp.]
MIIMVFAGANIAYPEYHPVDRLINGQGNQGNNTTSHGTHPVPFSNRNYTLSGNISNLYNGLPVHGTLIIKNSTMSRELNYSKNGTFSTVLPGGSYSITYSSPGFSNYTTSLYLNKNTTENQAITPAPSIGTGVYNIGSLGSIASNSVNISNTVPYLSNKSIPSSTGNNSINSKYKTNITLNLGKGLASKQFVALIEQNAAVYQYSGFTNSSGEDNITLGYSGNYTIAAYTLYYNSSAIRYNTAGGSGVINFHMVKRQTYNETVELSSDYLLNGSAAVNSSTLNAYGGVFSLQHTNITSNSSGTYYNYSIPSGMYRFSYTNPYFVGKSFTLNVTHSGYSRETVKAYIISVNITDNTGFSYSYTLSGIQYSNGAHRAYAGSNTLNINISGRIIDTKYIYLAPGTPYYGINLTINNNNFTLSGTENYNSGKTLYLNYTGIATNNSLISGMELKNIDFNGNTSYAKVIQGSNVTTVYGSMKNYEFNLKAPFVASSGSITVEFNINNTDAGESGVMQLYVLAYTVTGIGTYGSE